MSKLTRFPMLPYLFTLSILIGFFLLLPFDNWANGTNSDKKEIKALKNNIGFSKIIMIQFEKALLKQLSLSGLEMQNEELVFVPKENALSFVDPCPAGSGIIGGKAFGDFNYNSQNDQTGYIPDIKVYLYGCDVDDNTELLDSTVTDANGDYFFSGLMDGVQYRLEFIVPDHLPDYSPGFGGGDNGTTIQFITAPFCEANVAFTNPDDYCQDNPVLASSCFVNGDPLPGDSEAGEIDALVYFNWNDTGNSEDPSHAATAGQIGATYGMVFHKATKKVYASAFIKRHVGLGPLGLGGIYSLDFSDPNNPPTVSEFVDVSTIGISVGAFPSNSDRGLPILLEDPSNDPDAYPAVGKQGIGGLAISEEDGKLWLVNMTDNKLYSIEIDADDDPNTPPVANDVASFDITVPSCTNGNFRPLAIKYFRGDLYIGGVCDAATGQSFLDLEAFVYKFDGTTFTEVLNFALDFEKGYAASANNCDNFPGWFPWRDTPPPTCDAGATYVYPQPVLSDIEFDIDGSMVLGFMDRAGHQLGNKNYPPTGVLPLMSNISGGDILRVHNNAGTFEIENNATAGGHTTAGENNEQGPGGGEYYFQDIFAGPADNILPPPHAETSQGDLAFYPGAGQVASTSLDPYSTLFNSGGINWFNNTTGEVQLPGYVLYRTSSSSISTFSKANGLGGLVVMCDDNPPSEIGGFLWNDANNNGIQDACELALSDINVSLYDESGTLLTTIQTSSKGEYYFNHTTNGLDTILSNTTYYVAAGTGGQFDPQTGMLNSALFLTFNDVGDGHDPDKTDSDAQIAGSIAGGAFTGLPFIEVTTGGKGWVTHSADVGFAGENVNPIAGIGGFVWQDDDKDGIQDGGEIGIEGVTVQLFNDSDQLQGTVSTIADGTYFFANVSLGNYYLSFDESTNTNGITNYLGSPQNQGNGTDDSDPNPSNGQTNTFSFDPINGNNNDLDAGYFLNTGNIGGFVWEDTNEDGIQDGNENGIEGATVTLHNANTDAVLTTTTSDINGNYVFLDQNPGDYYIIFDADTNTGGITNYAGTLQNQGDGTNDSDPDQNTGQTNDFSFDPSNGNEGDIDAGYIIPTGNIGGFVWEDTNEDGIQDGGEVGIQGVTVKLFDADTDLEIGSTFTNGAGNYGFVNIGLGNYYVLFDQSTNNNGISNYQGTLQNQGNGSNDSDPNPNSGQTNTFTFDPANGNEGDIDAGYIIPSGALGGFVWEDTDEDGIQDGGEAGIPGVTVKLFNADTDIEINSTTTNGSGIYSFGSITLGNYYVLFDESTNTNGVSNYQGTLQNQGNGANDSDPNPNSGQTNNFTFDPTNGNNNDVDAGYYLPSGNISGFVWEDTDEDGIQDGGEAGIPGVTVKLFNADTDIEINSTTTNGSGNYTFSNVLLGNYYVLFDESTNTNGVSNYQGTLQNQGNGSNDSDPNPNSGQTNNFSFDPTNGNEDNIDAGYITPSGSLGGFVWEDSNEDGIQDGGEAGIPGVTVKLFNADTDLEINSTTTNGGGNYSFSNVELGNYYVLFDESTNTNGVSNYQGTLQNQGNGTNDSDPNPNSGQTNTFSFDPANGNNNDIDAGYILPTGNISGFVWEDNDEDGIQDGGEPGIEGVTVHLKNANNDATIETTQTNVAGNYLFENVLLGNYYVLFDESTNTNGITNYQGSPQNQGNGSNDSDPNPNTGQTNNFTFDPNNGNQSDIDAGYFVQTANISGLVWHDTDEDGIFENGEQGIENVTVTLFNDEDDEIGSTTTDSNGNYIFINVPADDYYVVFDSNSTGNPDYELTLQDQGNDDGIDSDPDQNSGQTDIFSFDPANGNKSDIYAGYILPFSTVGDFVFKDCNSNGIQDAGETGLANVPVTLTGIEVTGAPVNENTQTDANGFYIFNNVKPGNYSIIFGMPATPTGLDYSPKDQGGNDNLDSDADPNTGFTDPFALSGGETKNDIDAGLRDIEAPVFNNPPGDEILPCDDPQISTPPTLTATDNCDDNVTVTFDEMIDTGNGGGGCDGGLTITRTWVASDDCGNSTTHVQVISTGDEIPPFILNIPDITVECDSIINIDDVKGVDDCDTDVELTFEDISMTGECPVLVIRKWTATDDCGNMTMNTQKITLEDTTPPTITLVHPDLVGLQDGDMLFFECTGTDFVESDADITDNCDNDVIVTFEMLEEDGDCPTDGYFKQVTLTWTAEDNCGNSSSLTVMVFLTDTTPPIITDVPPDITVECDSIPTPGNPTVSDNCDEDIVLEFAEGNVGDTCADYKLIRIWSAMDLCGNMTMVQQTIFVVVGDIVITNIPADISIECQEEIPDPVTPNVESGCYDVNVELDEVLLEGDCEDKLVRTWTFTSDCGYEASASQVITLIDNTPPEIVLTNPLLAGVQNGDILEFNCDDAEVFTENDAEAVDSCSNATITFMEMPSIGDCIDDGYLIQLECCWKAEDACGNQSQLCITVRIIDTKAPELVDVPADITIDLSLGEMVPDAPTVLATDNCDDNVAVNFVETQTADPDGCGYTITRTWLAEDNCNNSISESQFITVEDLCDCPEVIVNGYHIDNTDCGENNGSITVELDVMANTLDYELIPSFGTPNTSGNIFTISDMPFGSYLLIINHPDFPDCDEKITFDLTQLGCADIMQVSIPMETTEVCIDENLLDYPGTVTSLSFCNTGNPNTVEASANNEDCIFLTPAPGFQGLSPDIICVVQCFNGSDMFCDTTYIEVTVDPSPASCNLEMLQVIKQEPNCENTGGSISITATGNIGNLIYEWEPNVSSSNIAVDLPEGAYGITLTDDETNCTLDTIIQLTAPIPADLTANDFMVSNLNCPSGNDGQIISNTNDAYFISDGVEIIGQTPQTNLVAGIYTLIYDNGTCSDEMQVEITEPPAWDIQISSTPETCAGNDGSITINVNGATPDYTYTWSPEISTSNIGIGLTSNTLYNVIIEDAQGCSQVLENIEITNDCMPTPCTLELTVAEQTAATCGESNGSIELSASGAIGLVSYEWTPAVSSANTATDLAGGSYSIIATDENECKDTLVIELEEFPSTLEASISIINESCIGNDGSITLDVSGGYGSLNYNWWPQNSTSNTINNISANEEYSVTITDSLGCTLIFDPLSVELDCTPTTETIVYDISCPDVTSELCVNMDELPGAFDTLQIYVEPEIGTLENLSDLCLLYTTEPDFEGIENITLVICDDLGLCDTTHFELNIEPCPPPHPCDYLFTQQSANGSTNDCDIAGTVCLDIPFEQALEWEILDNGDPLLNNIGGCMNDTMMAYSYFTIPGAGDEGPYNVESWMVNGNIFTGSFNSIPELLDLMNGWDATASWNLDSGTLNILGGNPQSSYSSLMIEQTLTGAIANLELNTNLIPNGTTIALMAGVHEIIFTDNNNCSDTMSIEVHCIPQEIIYDTIFVNTSAEYCISTADLPGTLTSVAATCNDCDNIDFFQQVDCVTYEGENIGEDLFFIVACDDLGLCDTTWLQIFVKEAPEPPDANIDVDTTAQNEQITIDVLQNDVLNGAIESIEIVHSALYGTATINPDNTITYEPNEDYCGLDAFAYSICNQFGCDSASVNLLVECQAPTPLSGFSPNGDGINEGFMIKNLELYPENELIIYNRWGEAVHKVEDYKGDWTGTYRSDKLPSGTYFYVFKYGNGMAMSGYVQIHR